MKHLILLILLIIYTILTFDLWILPAIITTSIYLFLYVAVRADIESYPIQLRKKRAEILENNKVFVFFTILKNLSFIYLVIYIIYLLIENFGGILG
jgi:hypothetical protein